MDDLHARQKAELDGLLGDRESTRNDSLRCDDSGQRRQHHQRQPCPFRRHQEEGVGDGFGMGGEQRTLAKIVDHQRRQHQREPGKANGVAAEMAHVGIKRFGAGHRQHDTAQRQERRARHGSNELEGIPGVQRPQDVRVGHDVADPQHCQRGEIDQHDRAEDGADLGRAAALEQEQAKQDGDGDRHHQRLHPGFDHGDAFHRRQHRHGGRDDGIAKEKGGRHHAKENELRRACVSG